MHVQLFQGCGHAERSEKAARLVDGRQRVGLDVAGGRKSEHLAAVVGEARRIGIVDVLHPGRKHDCQTRAVRDGGVQRRQLVLQPVRRPVLVATDAGKALVAEHSRPHDVRAGIVVVRLRHDARRLGPHGLHERQVEVVRHRHGAHVVKEALQQVTEHVGQTRRRLVRGKREGELRVHERELRALLVVGIARLQAQLVVAHHGVLRRLAAGGRDGEHHGDGQHVVGLTLRLEEVPHVAFVVRAHGDGLCRVDDRATAHGQNPVDVLFLAQRDALPHQADLGVRTHAAQLRVLDARRVERCFHAVDEPACDGALPAIVQQHAPRAALGQFRAHLLFRAAPEHEVRRRHEFEVLHGLRPFRRLFPQPSRTATKRWGRSARGPLC